MSEIENARAQRDALNSVATRKADGVVRRYGALGTYLAALLYEEEREPRPAKETNTETDTERDTETGPTR